MPCGQINSIDAVFAEPQSQARDHIVVQHRQGVEVRSVASPIRLSRTPVTYDLPPPTLGEHTETVLTERLALTAGETSQLRQSGVIR